VFTQKIAFLMVLADEKVGRALVLQHIGEILLQIPCSCSSCSDE
jgi:hypothetical protein